MPLPLLPLLLGGAAVIGLGATAASFIFNELTEAERIKQQEMKNHLDEFKKEQDIAFKEMLAKHKITESQFMNDTDEKIANLRKQYANSQNQVQYELSKMYIQFTYEHIHVSKEIQNEIRIARDGMKTIIKKEKTILRKEAMNYLWRELQIGYEKASSYVSYLYSHIEKIKVYRNQLKSDEFIFEFRLPKNYPHIGKLLFFEKERLLASDVLLSFNKFQSFNLVVEDLVELNNLPKEAKVPLFITSRVDNSTYNVSIGKGMFQFVAIQQSKVGVQATVKSFGERGQILLSYKGVELSMRSRDLKNPLKVPPIGANIRVYPTGWHGLLQHKIYVSEKYEDSLRAFQFTTLPIVFSNEGAHEFITYYKEQGIEGSSDEWKIGPDNNEVTSFKLQLGDFLVFTVQVVQGESPFLRYKQILPLDEAFKADDIFVVMDAEFEMVLESELMLLSEESHRNMFDLNVMILKEIQIQEQLKGSIEGLNFFAKWSEVTEKLINYLSKGTEIACELGAGTVEFYKTNFVELYKHRYEILNNDEVVNILNTISVHGLPQFFIEENQMKVEFDETNRHLICYSNQRELKFSHQKLVVFTRLFSYPEIQQRQALDSFREGVLLNAKLQPYIMNGANVQSETILLPKIPWKNTSLLSNLAQKKAVEQALAEKNLYLIQGPPGTGKTTVIRELIYQHLQLKPSSRILVVSQANVAIDNVLRGLDQQFENDMIRCGNIEKIDSDLKSVSFDEKYTEYEELIKNNNVPNYLQEFSNEWNKIITRENPGNAPIMGEILVRNHRIVGATCLGLMQRKIGLNRVEFDLVIIDEAGKALPAELLIPINRAIKLIMIGDHRQLPPVINPALYDAEKIELSEVAYCKNELFTTSLFKRLFEKLPPSNKIMLDTQYRMPAVIGNMISEFFYDGKLISHETTVEKSAVYFSKNLNFLNMERHSDYVENTEHGAVTNEYEAEIVVQLVQRIRDIRPISEKIAIICPYRGQNRLIKQVFSKQQLDLNKLNIAVNTIDAYQGDEAEIVIYCMTRSKRKTLYFSDEARLNVALSRVKNDLLIIGSMKYLKSYGENHILNKIADYIERNGEILTIENLKKYSQNIYSK